MEEKNGMRKRKVQTSEKGKGREWKSAWKGGNNTDKRKRKGLGGKGSESKEGKERKEEHG